MDRIQHETASQTRPAYTPTGTKGYATDFDPSTSTPATVNTPEQYNSIQETLMHTIEAADLSGDHADDSLLTKAVQKLASAGDVQTQVQANTNAISLIPSMGVGSITTGLGGTNPSFFVNKNSFFSSVTRIETGYYRFNYSTSQPNNNYTILVTIDWGTSWGAFKVRNQTTTSFEVGLISGNGGTGLDVANAKIHVSIIR
ncbi:MAG: hypothetical protein GY793_04745 [Proteobacteria bacterium]|nr:hypothetical protein [Pseudomonadota bacterium]